MPDEQPSDETQVPEEAETPVDPTPASPSTSSDSSESSSGEQLASDFKKAELKTAAEVVGADVPAKATKADLAQAIVETTSPTRPTVVVDNHTARDDNDGRFNSFVDVVDGDHKGRVGHYFETVDHDSDGYPHRILVRTRDARNEILHVLYEHVRPSRFTGGR